MEGGKRVGELGGCSLSLMRLWVVCSFIAFLKGMEIFIIISYAIDELMMRALFISHTDFVVMCGDGIGHS